MTAPPGGPPPSDEWLTPFTMNHALVVAVIAVVMAAVLVGARIAAKRGAGALYARAFGVFTAVFTLIYHVFWLTPPRLDLEASLPLHFCDVLSFFVPIALLTRWRFARSLLYHWGLTFSLIGYVIPVEHASPGEARFWIFWIAHVQLVLGALLIVVADGFRPTRRDLAIACAAAIVWGVSMMAFNAITGWNYAYVGPADDPETLTAFGDYPWRLPIIAAIALLGLSVAHAPWFFITKTR